MDVPEAKGVIMISDANFQKDEFQTIISENQGFVKEFIQKEIPLARVLQ